MKTDKRIIDRLNKLIAFEREVMTARIKVPNRHKEIIEITSERSGGADFELGSQWLISCLNFIEQVFGKKSIYYVELKNLFPNIFDEEVGETCVDKVNGILAAAKDDYENGYLFDTRVLIEAEVFDEFLEQAEELFKKNYYQAAAVITGCVLEDGLRKLSQRKIPSFPTDKTIDPMNIELSKAGIYNVLWQKKITALADLRNKAAHGKWTEFGEKDVEDMIRDVRRFMEDYFS